MTNPFHPPQILHNFPIRSQFIKLQTTNNSTILSSTIRLIMKLFPAICLLSIFHSPPQGWRQEAATRNPDSPMPSKGWLGGGDCYTMPFLGMYCINNLHIREKHSSALISLFSRNQNGEIAKFLYDPTLVRICTY